MKAPVNLHAGGLIGMEGTDAHPVPAHPDSEMLRSLPGGNRLLDSFKYIQFNPPEHKKSACHSHKENGKRRLVGSYSVLGMEKAQPVCRALVGGVWFSVSGWTMCPEVGACSAICCFLLSSHLKSVQNCLDKYKRSQNIHKNLDAHQYYN